MAVARQGRWSNFRRRRPESEALEPDPLPRRPKPSLDLLNSGGYAIVSSPKQDLEFMMTPYGTITGPELANLLREYHRRKQAPPRVDFEFGKLRLTIR